MKINRQLTWLAATFFFASVGLANTQQAKTVTIGLSSSSFATAGLRLASELGLFAKHGVDVKFVIADNSAVALAGLLSKSYEFASIGLPETFLAQAHGQKVVAIANTYGGFASSVVVSTAAAKKANVAPNAPIAQRLKALDGLLIAAPSATAGGTLAFKAAVQAQGANVRLTYMAQPAMQVAMETGSFDGYLSSAPFWAFPVVKGNGHVWISGPKNEFPTAPTVTAFLVTNRDYAEANAPLMASLKAAVVDLGKMIEQRPQDVKQALAKLYPDVTGPAMDLVFDVESISWNAKQLNAADMAREIKLVRAIGMEFPPLLDTIDPATILFP